MTRGDEAGDELRTELSVVPVSQVRGSSFYTAMRILPRAQRTAMYEIYAFCRAVDDIADGTEPRAERLRRLDAWRAALDQCFRGNPPPELRELAVQIAAFGLQLADFLAVIDGMQMDAEADIVAPTAAQLDLFCDRVASAVGRLSVRVFGLAESAGIELSHCLGRGLQLTNILRDLDEDARIGRLYLPRESLAAAGIPLGSPERMLADPRIGRVAMELAQTAQGHLDRAAHIMDTCSRKSVRAPRIMAAAYQIILRRLVARGFDSPRVPAKISRTALIGIVLHYAIV